MNTPGMQPNQPNLAKASVFNQNTQQTQRIIQAQIQQMGNSPLMMTHGGGVMNTASAQSLKGGMVASYFAISPTQVHIGQPTDQAKLAMAYDMIKRIMKGEATAPIDKLKELGALYEYLKKYMKERGEDGEHDEELEDLFELLERLLYRRSYGW